MLLGVCYSAAVALAVLAWVLSGKNLLLGAGWLLVGALLCIIAYSMRIRGRQMSVKWVASRFAWAMAMSSATAGHWATYVALSILVISDFAF
jgi:hypothetical protein